MLAALAKPSPLLSAELADWVCSARRPSFAIVALLFHGWKMQWSDGALQAALSLLSIRIRLEQWSALFSVACYFDERHQPRAAHQQMAGRHSRSAAANAIRAPQPSSSPGSLDGEAGSDDAAGRCSQLMLRAMLASQPASVCLGVLRREPRLADAMPPMGYVELLRALHQEGTGSRGLWVQEQWHVHTKNNVTGAAPLPVPV